MFENTDSTLFNKVLIEQLETADGHAKFASGGAAVVRNKIREMGFARKIIPFVPVTAAELQVHPEHDTLCRIVDIEHDSYAMAMNFDAQSEGVYIKGKRYLIPTYKVASAEFQKNEVELLAYRYPITKFIEENIVKDIQAIEDGRFLEHVDMAINKTGKCMGSPATSINRKEITSGFKMLGGDKLSCDLVLMNEVDHDDYAIQPATEVGSQAASEMFINGYTYKSIAGRKLLVTNKLELVAPGEVFFFSKPEFLGHALS